MKPLLLVLVHLADAHQAQIACHFDLLYAPTTDLRTAAVVSQGPRLQAVLTNGTTGLTVPEIDAMPLLQIVCALGAGYENIALDHARQRGLVVANGAGTNDDCVADHAFALLLSVVRGIGPLDRLCRDGVWRDAIALPPKVSHRRLGILGLGTIGRKIGRRAEGFEMQVGYHSRQPRNDLAYTYFADLLALAHWCDFLVVATPGGAATRHLVNAAVLQALGPRGVLVNIARGSVVDTAALAQALQQGQIAGAGLDVYESEPAPPAALLAYDNLVLTPHVAGWSPEAVQASVQRFIDNAVGHFDGTGAVSPV